jgi:phage terminase large subunit
VTAPVVPVNWEPWPHQLGFWNAKYRDGKKRFMEVWHRRAGKDITAMNMLAVDMFERPGTYWHIFPTYAQAKKAIWQGSTNAGNKFQSYIPRETVIRTRNDEMLIEVDTGQGIDRTSTYQLIGGDQPDRLVGTNVMGAVFSEFSLMNPLCWELVRPIVEANDGWVAFIFTPRGYNHAYDMYSRVKEMDHWHTSVLDISKTLRDDGKPIMTGEAVERQIAEGMPEELARQEFYCDWSAPMTGAYFGKEMDAADREGRIVSDLRWEREHPVYTSWDLGIRDTMVVWFYQIIDGWVHYIDLLAHSGEGIEWFAKELDKKPYVYAKHYAPHDAAQREIGSGKSRVETAYQLGLKLQVVPRVGSVETRVNAIRLSLPKCRFHSEKCAQGIAALRQYRKEFDHKNRVWGAKPVHDWTSHFADAFGTGSMVLPDLVPRMVRPAKWQSDLTFGELLNYHDKVVERDKASRGRDFKAV